MKRFFIALLVLIAIVAGGGYFLFLKIITPEDMPAKVINTEEAIATQGTVAIASVDMTYIRRIDEMFNPNKDPSPLPVSKSAKSKPEKTLLDKLNEQGINLLKETDYAVATVNMSQGKPTYTVVMYGRFKPDNVMKVVHQQYLIDESAEGYWLLEKLPEQKKNNDPCLVKSAEKKLASVKYALHIKNDRIILSSPELMPILLNRLTQKARAGISLTKWRQFRKEKAVAGAFISPKVTQKGALDLPSALFMNALSKQPLEDIYAAAELSLLPSPGFTLLMDAHSKETAWPLKIKSNYDSWVTETVEGLEEIPTLAALFKTLNVQADGNILRFKTIANKTMLENLEKIPAEFLQMALSGAFGDGQEAGHAGEEQIVNDSEVAKYAQRFDFSTIKPFDAKNVLFKPDHIAGPFAVRLKKMGLLAIDDSIIELKVDAEGKGFENLSAELMHKSDDSAAAGLLVTGVEDKKGNNLLREELCGKTRNLAMAALHTSRDKEHVDGQWVPKSIKVNGDKSVRLKKNVSLSQVAKIKGKITVHAATRTKTQKLQSPFFRKTIETDKVRMYFRKSNSSTVKYTLSGDTSHIMAVRAKNAKGQYLASASSSASGKDTKRVSKRFKGKVASIEVVVAEQMKSKEYPFEISQITPRYGKQDGGKEVEMMVTPKRRFLRKYAKIKYKNECKDKQKVALGSFLVCLNKFGDRLGREIGGEFDVIAPNDAALQNDLSAGVLSIDAVFTESGEKIVFDKNEKVSFNYKFDTNYNDKKKEWEIINRRLQATSVNIFVDKKELKNKKISKVKGSLTIRLPKHPKYIELGADELGVIKKTKDNISAKVAGFEDWNTFIDLQGSIDKVMRFVPISKSRVVLNTDNDRINEKQYQTWGMSIDDKEKIKSLPKKWQGMISIFGKPEVIRVYYANKFELIKHQFQFTLK